MHRAPIALARIAFLCFLVSRASVALGDTTQEIGGAVGAEVGGRLTPGGVRGSGRYLYRLTDEDWLVSSIGFTIGSSGADCFRNRSNDVICDHGAFSGSAADIAAGVRRYFPGTGQFQPFAQADLLIRMISFAVDDIRGAAIVPRLAGGVRADLGSGINIVAGAALSLGVGVFNRGIGADRQIGLNIHAGVEFALD